jgi:hypothetical protein
LVAAYCNPKIFTRAFQLRSFVGMARNVNLTITSENDGTTRDSVPDYLVHLATWINGNGVARSFEQDRYLLGQMNWLITNHPQVARPFFENLVYRIERIRQGIDDPEDIG